MRRRTETPDDSDAAGKCPRRRHNREGNKTMVFSKREHAENSGTERNQAVRRHDPLKNLRSGYGAHDEAAQANAEHQARLAAAYVPNPDYDRLAEAIADGRTTPSPTMRIDVGMYLQQKAAYEAKGKAKTSRTLAEWREHDTQERKKARRQREETRRLRDEAAEIEGEE